jgi:hypothetical protein
VFNNQLLLIPFAPSNYIQTWQAAPVRKWNFNSLYIGVLAAVLVTFSSALTAFTFAYFRFPRAQFPFRLRPGHHDASGRGHHDPGLPDLGPYSPGQFVFFTGQRYLVEGIVTQCGKG